MRKAPALTPANRSSSFREGSSRRGSLSRSIKRIARRLSVSDVPAASDDGADGRTATGGLSSSAHTMRRESLPDAMGASQRSAESLDFRTSLFCPLPKRGFFYSRAYKEHKKKRKEKQARLREHSDDGSVSVDDDIPLKRDLTRRKRNSFDRDLLAGAGVFEPTNVRAYLAARIESEKPEVKGAEYDHGAALVDVWQSKSHMMDVTLVGKDEAPVRASRFILASYSPVLEEVFFKERECSEYDAASSTLVIDFCFENVIRAAVHHSFSGELPPRFDIMSPSEGVARDLAQLNHLANTYKFENLGEVSYRALRKLINRRAVLACAIFDELSFGEGDGVFFGADSIKFYALDTMRDMPMDTLLGGGVQWMKESAMEAIMQDQDLDVDEFYMFKILKAWTGADAEGRLPVARRLSRLIELKFIEPELLETQVKESGYFEEKQIDEAVKLIKDSLAARDPREMERVLVEGAGTEIVNGIYSRVEGELGMSEEEILFVKEAEDGYSDVGLYLWGVKWHIAMCADYSNCFYSCDDPPDKSPAELVPGTNWTVMYSGIDPPPLCTYLPNTRKGRFGNVVEKDILAPSLEEMMDPTIAEKRRSDYFDRKYDDVPEKRSMTLEQMMNLPEDKREICTVTSMSSSTHSDNHFD